MTSSEVSQERAGMCSASVCSSCLTHQAELPSNGFYYGWKVISVGIFSCTTSDTKDRNVIQSEIRGGVGQDFE